jgi:flagellar protein FliO/FliZ
MLTGKTIVILQKTFDLNALNATPTITPTITPGAPTSMGATNMENFSQMIGLVFLLIIILIAAYFTSKFVGGIKLGQLKNSNFKVIDSYRISPNKVIQIVKIGNKYMVIAIAKDTINVITELEEAEVLIKEVHQGERQNFKQILEKLRNNNE